MARAAAATTGSARRRTTTQSSRRGGGIRWERVGRLALLGVLGIIVLLYIPPVTHWFQQRSTATRSQQQLSELEAERARLKARLRELSGPGAIEREARKLGMTRRDERPYVVRP
jgi:cell division protein FtsB